MCCIYCVVRIDVMHLPTLWVLRRVEPPKPLIYTHCIVLYHATAITCKHTYATNIAWSPHLSDICPPDCPNHTDQTYLKTYMIKHARYWMINLMTKIAPLGMCNNVCHKCTSKTQRKINVSTPFKHTPKLTPYKTEFEQNEKKTILNQGRFLQKKPQVFENCSWREGALTHWSSMWRMY